MNAERSLPLLGAASQAGATPAVWLHCRQACPKSGSHVALDSRLLEAIQAYRTERVWCIIVMSQAKRQWAQVVCDAEGGQKAPVRIYQNCNIFLSEPGPSFSPEDGSASKTGLVAVCGKQRAASRC